MYHLTKKIRIFYDTIGNIFTNRKKCCPEKKQHILGKPSAYPVLSKTKCLTFFQFDYRTKVFRIPRPDKRPVE